MSPSDVAGTLLASALVACSGSMLLDLDVDQEHDRASTAEHLTGLPNVWSDGSLVCEITEVLSGGSVVVARLSGLS